MRNATYFAKECSTCGRTLQVRIEYLGKRMACPHCRAILLATDSQIAGTLKPPAHITQERIDKLLALDDTALISARHSEAS